jgi:predicted enzyme related to lactoylglutathione lyase
MAASLGKFVWYELLTTDVEAAEAFYRKVIGWDIQDSGHPTMTYLMCKAAGHGVGGMMTLPEDARNAGATPFWSAYTWVPSVEDAAVALEAAGYSLHRPPADSPESAASPWSAIRKAPISRCFAISAIRKLRRSRRVRWVLPAGMSCARAIA